MAGVASSLNKVGGIQHKSTWLSADIRLYFITVLLDPMGQILAYLLARARNSPQAGPKFLLTVTHKNPYHGVGWEKIGSRSHWLYKKITNLF